MRKIDRLFNGEYNPTNYMEPDKGCQLDDSTAEYGCFAWPASILRVEPVLMPHDAIFHIPCGFFLGSIYFIDWQFFEEWRRFGDRQKTKRTRV